MTPIPCEFWGGPADGLHTHVPSEPGNEIPAWEPYRVPLDDRHKPMIDADVSPARTHSFAVYTRGLPRNGRWLYAFQKVESV